MSGIFITATGTDVGKTYCSALLVKWLREQGIDAGYYKPALSGATRDGDRLIPGDAAYVCQIASLRDRPEALVSYCFEHAVSPHLAARLEGRSIEPEKIQADFQAAAERCEFLVVEGCGGAICPLRDGEHPVMLLDVIRLLGLDVLIVSNAGLGAINSAVLTADYLKRNGIGIRGIFLNRFDPNQLIDQDNRVQIERLTGLPVLACVQEGDQSLNDRVQSDFLSKLR